MPDNARMERETCVFKFCICIQLYVLFVISFDMFMIFRDVVPFFTQLCCKLTYTVLQYYLDVRTKFLFLKNVLIKFNNIVRVLSCYAC